MSWREPRGLPTPRRTQPVSEGRSSGPGQSYDSKDGRLRALFDLAGVLRESGELSAAWDAYAVVASQVEGLEARILALDALAFAEEHGLNKLIFDAEAALKESASVQTLQTAQPTYQDSTPEEILGVRRGLREMREAQTDTGESV